MNTMSLSRREFLTKVGIGTGALALAGCTITTKDGVTTITMNVAEVVGDTNIALEVVKTVLGFTAVPAGVVSVVDEGISLITAGLTTFKNTAGSTLTLTFDATSVPAAFSSLVADMSTVSKQIAAVAETEAAYIDSTLMAKISSVSADVGTVSSVLSSILTTSTSTSLRSERVGGEAGRRMRMDAVKARHGLS